jgi:putative tricarboxylic transport membrane protein
MQARLNRIVPYVVVLLIAGYLYFVAGRIDFAAPGGRIGPDFWPKTILVLAMVTCAYEIIKNLFFGKAENELGGVLQSIIKEAPADAPQEIQPDKAYPYRLAAGIAITIGYAFVIEYLGFFLTTFLYLAAFMAIGRYLRWGVVLTTSLVGSLVFMFVFMKIVYVSLPLGQEPFAQLTYLLMRVMGIR